MLRSRKPKISCDLLYCKVCFIAMVWNPIYNISKVSLYSFRGVCVCVCMWYFNLVRLPHKSIRKIALLQQIKAQRNEGTKKKKIKQIYIKKMFDHKKIKAHINTKATRNILCITVNYNKWGCSETVTLIYCWQFIHQ